MRPSLRAALLENLQGCVQELPIQATSFVGRQSEVEAVQTLLGKRRLVTLVGSGGCGKTRLALEVAATQLERFEGGVWFVDFSPLTAGEQVARTVADVLGIKVEAEKSPFDSILTSLKTGMSLLLLDNCEHLLDACAELASAILSHCPGVSMVATSRELLSVRGETMLRVPSLSLPEGEVRTEADILKTEAGRLFLERANDQGGGVEIDEQNVAAIAGICSRLDGIPLAIELAAAQVRTLSVKEIHDSLSNCFRILTSGERSALPRQRTIRATIEWSADMLDLDQRRLLHRLSVFTGGFTLEAVDTICGDGESQLPCLLALADKNLILAREPGKGERRRLLETVRQFAQQHLFQDGKDQHILRRHRDYFQRMASDARPEKHQDTAGWLERLSADRNNLREAIEWSLEQPDGLEAALRMAADLGWYWYQQGQILDGCDLLSRGLAMPLHAITADTRLDALYTHAWLLNSMGDAHVATHRFKDMAVLAIDLGDRRHEAEALNGLGLVTYHQDYEEARSFFEDALAINRTLPNGGNSLANLNNLCLLALSVGEYEAAHRYGEEVLRIARQMGRLEVEGVALFLMAVNAEAMEAYDRACELYQEAEKHQRKHGFRQRLLHTLIMRGDHCMDTDDPQGAQNLYRQAVGMCQELHAATVEHQVLCGFGACLATLGRAEESQRQLVKGLELCKTVDDKGHLARALEDVSVYLVVEGELESSARLLGAAWKRREEHPGMIHPSTLRRCERLSRPVRDALGAPAFDRLYEDGRRLSSLRAIEFALDCLVDSSGGA